jgi:hypothetical protein
MLAVIDTPNPRALLRRINKDRQSQDFQVEDFPPNWIRLHGTDKWRASTRYIGMFDVIKVLAELWLCF